MDRSLSTHHSSIGTSMPFIVHSSWPRPKRWPRETHACDAGGIEQEEGGISQPRERRELHSSSVQRIVPGKPGLAGQVRRRCWGPRIVVIYQHRFFMTRTRLSQLGTPGCPIRSLATSLAS